MSELHKKTLTATITKGEGEKQGLYLFVISDGLKDRHGESINPEGWDFKEFNDNPVALVGHDYGALPIGKWLPPFVEGGQVKAYLELADTPRAQEAKQLIEGGFLKTVSVGFRVEDFGENGDEYDIMKQMLYEVSLVSIPANSRAQRVKDAQALQAFENIDKDIEEAKKKEEQEEDEGEESMNIAMKQILTALEELKEKVDAIEGKKIVEEKIVEKVVTVKGEPVEGNVKPNIILMEIAKQNQKIQNKQNHVGALLQAMTQNVTTFDKGGVE